MTKHFTWPILDQLIIIFLFKWFHYRLIIRLKYLFGSIEF